MPDFKSLPEKSSGERLGEDGGALRPNQVPWDPGDPDYISSSEAQVMSGSKLTLSAISKLTSRDTKIRFMRKARRRRVHKGDFAAHLLDRGITPVAISDELPDGVTTAEQLRYDKERSKKGTPGK